MFALSQSPATVGDGTAFGMPTPRLLYNSYFVGATAGYLRFSFRRNLGAESDLYQMNIRYAGISSGSTSFSSVNVNLNSTNEIFGGLVRSTNSPLRVRVTTSGGYGGGVFSGTYNSWLEPGTVLGSPQWEISAAYSCQTIFKIEFGLVGDGLSAANDMNTLEIQATISS